MNAAMHAQKSASYNDTRAVRCDANGRLITSGGKVDVKLIGATDGAYAAGQVIAASNSASAIDVTPLGALNSANAIDGLVLDSLSVIDPGNKGANLGILFFSDDPFWAAGAAELDKAAFNWGGADDVADICLGCVEIVAADWKTINGKGVATLNNLGLALAALQGNIWYIVVLLSGAPNWAGGANLHVKTGIRRA